MIKKKNQMRLLVSGFFRAIKIYTRLSLKKKLPVSETNFN